jgi:signal transduction histidine kinase
MGGFVAGLVAGLLGAGAALAVAGIRVYRRLLSLQQRTRQAERMAELGVLTGGLAHEIRNPLSTVQLNLQLLAEELESDGNGHNRLLPRLATVQSETSRLRDILDDFLRYAGKIELSRSDVDLHQLLVEMADFFAPQAQLNRVRLHVADSSQIVMAHVDGRLVRQAVLNLMINANQAMTNGGELILRASRGEDEALIDVIDTGPGIEPPEVERIFQAYYSRKAGGSGLGLAMTRRIIEEHGGRVTVQSEPGKGSQFTLHFPVKK